MSGSESQNHLLYSLAGDEKAAQVMAYTSAGLFWGEVVVKAQIRVSTWLRTNLAPDTLCFYNARAILVAANTTPNPLAFRELHLPTNEVLAFHLLPPAKDPLDYDPSEPNRQMVAITALFGLFRLDGLMRMSTRSSLAKYLDVTRENFTALYEAQISCPVMPDLKVLQTPYVLVRQVSSSFASR